MKCLKRNKVAFYYALYQGKQPIIDSSGNDTGEYENAYSTPTLYMANISAAKGETEVRQFGDNLAYDKVIVMDNNAPEIDEYSILWVDTLPELDREGNLTTDEAEEVITPHDYIVKKVAKSLNSVSLAISKVNVSATVVTPATNGEVATNGEENINDQSG